MTKQRVKATLELAVNMAQQTKKLLDTLQTDIMQQPDAFIPAYMSKIQNCEKTDANKMMEDLEVFGYLKGMEEGEKLTCPQVSVNPNIPTDIEVSIPIKDSERLTAYVHESDFGTLQAGTVYYDKDNSPLDLSLAEIKKGELAENSGLDKDNQDIDLMVWSDPHNEDYTNSYRISHDDIENALECDEELDLD